MKYPEAIEEKKDEERTDNRQLVRRSQQVKGKTGSRHVTKIKRQNWSETGGNTSGPRVLVPGLVILVSTPS